VRSRAANSRGGIRDLTDDRTSGMPQAGAGLGGGGNGAPFTAIPGFGFYADGLIDANELLGAGVYPHAIVFKNADPNSIVESVIPAAADASLVITAGNPIAAETVVGNINFAAGSQSGVVVWNVSPYTLAKDHILRLYGPASPDATLASIAGHVPAAMP
jgi:hypothetical protein